MKKLLALMILTSLPLFSCADHQIREESVTAASAAAAISCANPVGQWQNQMGSILEIQSVTATGLISGRYATATGGGGIGNWYPLTGWTNSQPPSPGADNAKIISFSVRWGTYGSVTSWTGICRGNDDLKTLWHLGRSNSQYEWDHILSGADNFRPLT